MEALWHEIGKDARREGKRKKERTKSSYEANKNYVKRKGGEITQAELQETGA